MKVLTAAQMREIDRITIDDLGMPSLTLMENAGVRFVETLESRYAPLNKHRVTILCGKGNNGGDGFVVGPQLWLRGGTPPLVLPCHPATLRAAAAGDYHYLTP